MANIFFNFKTNYLFNANVSGIEDAMIGATNELFDIRNHNREIKDLRTAAFVNGIDKLATSYLQLGVFP
ncbi:MAG: hypothetical protein KBB37_00895 [Bacteroidia bacterium]|nr:hypothetical protein [Bacteroidia bacterium]MBP9723211.1 hypothetical protein [Bacteroidia bacterium]